MCQLASKFFKTVEAKFKGDERLEKPLEAKIYNKDNYTIGSANIYFKLESEAFFQELVSYAEDFLTDFAEAGGEIQIADIQAGKNIDLGAEQTRILAGKIFEVYCYKCFSIAFIRILLEEGIYYRQSWVSIDIDEIANTPWFSEDF